MCSARKETVQRNKKKAPKSKQIRSFVSLTSCSLMDSATASLMKKEKKERRKSETTLSLYVCVVLTGYLIHSLTKRRRQRERERETRSEQRRREGAAGEKSEVVPPFPVTRETNALSKKNGQWQTPAIVFRQKVTWLPKHHSLYTEREEKRIKKKDGVFGWRGDRGPKIKRQG